MAWVYVMRCRDGSYYVGSTRNLEVRVWQHQNGLGAEYTQHRLPVELVWALECERVDEAFALEKRSGLVAGETQSADSGRLRRSAVAESWLLPQVI